MPPPLYGAPPPQFPPPHYGAPPQLQPPPGALPPHYGYPPSVPHMGQPGENGLAYPGPLLFTTPVRTLPARSFAPATRSPSPAPVRHPLPAFPFFNSTDAGPSGWYSRLPSWPRQHTSEAHTLDLVRTTRPVPPPLQELIQHGSLLLRDHSRLPTLVFSPCIGPPSPSHAQP